MDKQPVFEGQVAADSRALGMNHMPVAQGRKPCTSSITSSPSASSDTTVVADSCQPSPPATVCLMASLLPTSSRF